MCAGSEQREYVCFFCKLLCCKSAQSEEMNIIDLFLEEYEKLGEQWEMANS
jgi:hypothetical protein